MARIEKGKLHELLQAIPPSRVSMLIRVLPDCNSRDAVRTAYPNALYHKIDTADVGVYDMVSLGHLLNAHPGETVVLDITLPDPVVRPEVSNLLRIYINNGGQVIIIGCGPVSLSDAALSDRLLPIVITEGNSHGT